MKIIILCITLLVLPGMAFTQSSSDDLEELVRLADEYVKKGLKNEAFPLYKKAAELGNAGGQRGLGDCYYFPIGVTKDDNQAVYWYTKAAELGDSEAQYRLGIFYQEGYVVSKDFVKAKELLLKAAQGGIGKAYGQIGQYYSQEVKDYSQAIEWFKKGVEQGNLIEHDRSYEYYRIGICYKNLKEYNQAIEWYIKATEYTYGYVDWAIKGISDCYFELKEYHKAVEWIRKSAEREKKPDDWAQNKLGECYYFGHGVESNYDKAMEWFIKAAENDNEEAKYNLKFLGVQYVNSQPYLTYYHITENVNYTKLDFSKINIEKYGNRYRVSLPFIVTVTPSDGELFWLSLISPKGYYHASIFYDDNNYGVGGETSSYETNRYEIDDVSYVLEPYLTAKIVPGSYKLRLFFYDDPKNDDVRVSIGYSTQAVYEYVKGLYSKER